MRDRSPSFTHFQRQVQRLDVAQSGQSARPGTEKSPERSRTDSIFHEIICIYGALSFINTYKGECTNENKKRNSNAKLLFIMPF